MLIDLVDHGVKDRSPPAVETETVGGPQELQTLRSLVSGIQKILFSFL